MAQGAGKAAILDDSVERELYLRGARCWFTRRCDPVSFVVLAAALASLAWVLAFEAKSSRSGYYLYFGLSAWIPLLSVRAAFWLATAEGARDVARDLWMTRVGPGPWASGFLLPVQAAGILCVAPVVAWIAFWYPHYFSGYRGLVFVILWVGFIVSAVMDPVLAFALVTRGPRPRRRAVLVSLGLMLLKPFPIMVFLDEAFRFGRGDGKAMIVAGAMIVAAHAWVLRRVLARFGELVVEWAGEA